MRCLNLMTIYQPLPGFSNVKKKITVQNVQNQADRRLTRTFGNVNFTDSWISKVDNFIETERGYSVQNLNLLSDENNNSDLQNFWQNHNNKVALLSLIKTKKGKKPPIDENSIKVFRTLDNADFVLFSFYETTGEAEAYAKSFKDKYCGANNVCHSFYSVIGKFTYDSCKEQCIFSNIIASKHFFWHKSNITENGWCKVTMSELKGKIQEHLGSKNVKWSSYYYSIYQIVSLLDQYEQDEAFRDLFYIFFPPLRLFLEQLEAGLEKIDEIQTDDISENRKNQEEYSNSQTIENSVCEFIDAMELLIQYMGLNRTNILASADRNGLPYNMSIRLYLMYIAALHEISMVFNDTGNKYRFLLEPVAYSRPITSIYDFKLDATNRLIRVKLARHQLYSPRALFAILTHEGGHYIGDSRKRGERAQHFVWISSAILLEMLFPDSEFEKIMAGVSLNGNDKSLLRKDWIQRKIYFMKYFFKTLNREVVEANEFFLDDQKYHFENLNKTIWHTIRHTILYDEENILIEHMNKVTPELRNRMNKMNITADIVKVLKKENTIFETRKMTILLSRELKNHLENVKNNMKEIYADYGAILMFDLSPADYLESYLLSESYEPKVELINNILINRITLVHGVMSKNNPKWKEDWDNLSTDLESSPFLIEVKNRVDKYYANYENNNTSTALNGIAQQKGNYDPFLEKQIIDREFRYAKIVYDALKARIDQPEIQHNRQLLKNVYKHFMVYEKDKETPYDNFFQDLYYMVDDYKTAVKEEWECWDREQERK